MDKSKANKVGRVPNIGSLILSMIYIQADCFRRLCSEMSTHFGLDSGQRQAEGGTERALQAEGTACAKSCGCRSRRWLLESRERGEGVMRQGRGCGHKGEVWIPRGF